MKDKDAKIFVASVNKASKRLEHYGDASLNGGDLVSSAREDQTRMRDKLRETLDQLTYGKLIEAKSAEQESLQTVLKRIPIPIGKAITIG